MQRRNRAHPGVNRRFDTAPCRLGPRQQPVNPLGLFRIGQDRTIGHEVARLVFPLAIIENGFHVVSFSISSGAPDRTMLVSPVDASKPSRS